MSVRMRSVLILVLMEDTLRDGEENRFLPVKFVLILVLMEDTLRELASRRRKKTRSVLILVLMEDTLRAEIEGRTLSDFEDGLNPCFNGRYSQRNK